MSILGKTRGRPLSRIQFDLILKRFLIFLKRELQLTYDIPIILVDDVEFSKKNKTFGMITSENVIMVSIVNRHPMDVLRTISHEYVHYKQYIEKRISRISKAGSSSENQANSKAGEIIRKYGDLHPELFDYTPIR